jgi:Carbohydrate family 9 binding domain-like
MQRSFLALAVVALALPASAQLAADVRGLATRAPSGMKIDGDLAEWAGAFCTPVDYFNADNKNRPAQFFYMWDDEAFYAALRTLDEKPANFAPDDKLWEGDGVEWYFDTRAEPATAWGPGAVHCYWAALTGTEIKPRFLVRSNYFPAAIREREKDFPKKGIEVGARRTLVGVEMEFKLPWANFPEFKPRKDATIRLDAELCSGDGSQESAQLRTSRYFVYGSPLSVANPASFATIQLVEKLEAASRKSPASSRFLPTFPTHRVASCFACWISAAKRLGISLRKSKRGRLRASFRRQSRNGRRR